MRTKEWLKEKRNERNISQRQLAQKIDMSVFGIQQIEQGVRKGSDYTWNKIEAFFENDTTVQPTKKIDLKISDLYLINILEQKASLLSNYASQETNNFYDFYFENELVWLLENEYKIEEDFTNNIDKLKFGIISSSDLDERVSLILKLKHATINEFAKYIDYRPYEILKNNERNKIEKQFEQFKKYDDDEAVEYFDRIKR